MCKYYEVSFLAVGIIGTIIWNKLKNYIFFSKFRFKKKCVLYCKKYKKNNPKKQTNTYYRDMSIKQSLIIPLLFMTFLKQVFIFAQRKWPFFILRENTAIYFNVGFVTTWLTMNLTFFLNKFERWRVTCAIVLTYFTCCIT